jgi:hypothetical protein
MPSVTRSQSLDMVAAAIISMGVVLAISLFLDGGLTLRDLRADQRAISRKFGRDIF